MSNTFPTYCKYLLISGLASAVVSCSNTRFLKENQMLYTGAEVKIESDTISKKKKKDLQAALEANLTPKPNSTF